MKVTGIRMENVLGIKDVDVKLTHPIAIFCGDNNVGKTSIQEGVRLAFTGEAARVLKKKDYGKLLREGSKSGSSIVEFQHGGKAGRATFLVPSGKQECSPQAPPEIAFILDAARFTSLVENDRRKFLFDLFKVKANLEAVAERLVKKGCDEGLVKLVLPILRTGFEPGANYAIEQTQQWRANWKATTGETYGEVKAETWKAPLTAAEVNKEAIAGLEKTIGELTEDVRDLQKKIGAGEAYLANKKRYDTEAVALKDKSGDVGKLKREVSDTEKSLTKARTTLEKSKPKLSDARLVGQACPSCGVVLAVREEGKLVEVDVKKPAQIASMEAAVQADEAAVRTIEQTLASLRNSYNEAMAATSALAALEEAMGAPTTLDDLLELRNSEKAVQFDIDDMQKDKAGLETALAQAEEAKKKTADAREAHGMVKAWDLLKELLSPGGIPGEILEEALGPLNDRLKVSAKKTGWPVAQLRGDMEIMVENLPYSLQGESMRWRVDAMIAEGIAQAAGLKMLVLDRIDVLSVQRRGDLINWCFDLTETDGYESILLFGTLKEKPKFDDANVFWIVGGRA